MALLFQDRRCAGHVETPSRRRGLQHLLGLGVLGLTGCATRQSEAPADGSVPARQVAPFSAAAAGSALPPGWQPYVWRRDKPSTQYTVVADERRHVLHARADSAASGLRCAVQIDPLAQPRLRFSWRTKALPGPINVEAAESDDSPARIILAFEGDASKLSLRERLIADQVELFTGHRMPYATLMYVWDGSLPAESVVHNHRSSRVRYLAAETGTHRCGHWLHYDRDVVADFRRAFGETPGALISVGVLTDSDATKQLFNAWYGDISLSAA